MRHKVRVQTDGGLKTGLDVIKAAIIGALLPHPIAARDVEAAITRLLGEDETADDN